MENQEKPENPNAYPTRTEYEDPTNPIYSGMSLRDHFAGLAMQGFLSNNTIVDDVNDQAIEWAAARSYLIADAMLKQRSL
jgi:hypothetical protein